ncbi:MAG TPA: SDR family oxidoreductase [Candidatus Thermoplasmatota archaeon]|nr:SDR family oxidoreductase [Candidatus Thermoplasmatota archaeon]
MNLKGKVALVAGATRGAGRGIAAMLGEAGATVWCTGRSVAGASATPGRPETLEETAALVESKGGDAFVARVDHTREDDVRRLFERVRAESGGLDILVNDIWGGDARTAWGTPFWKLDPADAEAMIRSGLLTHLVTARHGVPLLRERGKGLVVELTDGDGGNYRGHLYYDLVKMAVARLAFGMSEELRASNVAAVAVTPGFMRSEAVLDHFGVTESTWRDGVAKDANFAHSETPFFVGRAVAALAADPRVMEKTGRVFASWTLSDEYGFTDVDGRRPHWGRHFATAYPGATRPLDDGYYAYWRGYEAMASVFGSGT